MPRSHRARVGGAILIAWILVTVGGCASYPKTKPLTLYDLSAGYRFEQLPPGLRAGSAGRNSDHLFVVLAFSGGGTRAAALSYGVLRQLRDVRFHVDDETGAPVECAPRESPRCLMNATAGGAFR